MKTNKGGRMRAMLASLTALGLLWLGSTLHAQQGKQPTQRIVAGKVVHKNGQPASNVVVFLKDTKSLFIKSYLTDAQGHFRFNQLSLSTDYDLWAEDHGVHSKTKHISTFNDKPNLDYTLKVDTSK